MGHRGDARDVDTIQGVVGANAFLTRPADTTAYASGDEISSDTVAGTAQIFEFKNAARNAGGRGMLLSVASGSNSNLARTLRMMLFNALPTLAGDNAPAALLEADYSKLAVFFTGVTVSVAVNPTGSTLGTGFNTGNGYFAYPYKCAAGSTSLYGMFVAGAAITPASNEHFFATIGIERF